MLASGYSSCLGLATMWRDMAETVYGDPLLVTLIGYRILRELAPVRIVIAVEVDGSHAEGTEQPEPSDALAACVAVTS